MKYKGNGYTETLVYKWTSWTNSKSILSNIGRGGAYNLGNYTPVDMVEIKQCIGILILNGLGTLPRLEYEFNSQLDDPVNGSDMMCE